MTLRQCNPGDVVEYNAGHVVLAGIVAGHSFVRWCDCVSYRPISEPFFLSPDTEVVVVRRGVERWPKAHGATVDPLGGAS